MAGTLSATVGLPLPTPRPTSFTAGGTLAAFDSSPRYAIGAALVGTGLFDPTARAQLHATMGPLSDAFSRPDSTTSAGPNWTNRNGSVGVLNGAAYATDSAGWCVASHDTPLNADDSQEVSITIGDQLGVGDGGNYTIFGLGANAEGEAIFGHSSGNNGVIYTQTSWALDGLVQQGAEYMGGVTKGDQLTLRRFNGNQYWLLKNGTFVVGWTDSTNLLPRSGSHRLAFIGAHQASSRSIDAFTASSSGVGLSASGALSAAFITRGAVAAPTTAAGTLSAVATRVIPVSTIGATLAGTGALSATATGTLNYSPFNQENVTVPAGTPVPAGAAGCWVTLIGGGGGGGRGAAGTASGAHNGGGGGGGGGRVSRVFIPVGSLGSTYSINRGLGGAEMTDGGVSVFVAQAIRLTANGGSRGVNGAIGGGGGNGGAGGTGTASGIAATTFSGTAGATSVSGGAGTPPTPATNTGNAGAGGGAGRGVSSGGTSGSAGRGGSSSTVTNVTPGPQPDAAAGNAGAGGNGGASPNNLGGDYGGGAGGSASSSTATANPGGTGGDGYTMIEWV